jgi:tetratricopeptide (TPR) repeat protein
LEQALQFAAQGKFEEALQKHIWYHDHALEINQAHYGVRLSYALSYWIDLGKKYPKALDALKTIRDQKTRRVLGGELNRALFHDVASINYVLGESRATVELFKKLDAAWPEFAASVSDMADKALFTAKEYQLERKYWGDPCSRFDRAKSTLDWGFNYAKTSKNPVLSRKSHEIIFSGDVVRLIVVLEQTGDREFARQIQADALAVCNSADIANALAK